jgi:folate-binding protein YgfZ
VTVTAAQDRALVVVWPELGTLVATGRERQTWLGRIVTCDVAGLAPGEGAFGLVLTRKGRILSDLSVVTAPDCVYLSTAPGRAAQIHQHLDRLLVMEDAEVEDRSDAWIWVSIHGPRAAALAREAAQRFEQAACSAIDWTGRGGAAVLATRTRCEELVAEMLEWGGDRVVRGAEQDWERLRIQSCLPRYGVDYDDRHTPAEAWLDRRAISWTKGCYVGQEVVCRQDTRGHARSQLVSLQLAVDAPHPPGTSVHVGADRDPAGAITSSAAGESGGQAVAIARLQTAAIAAGTPVTVNGVRATLVDPPAAR